MSGIKNEIENAFKQGDALTRLIFINLGVFLVYTLVSIFGYLFKIPLAGYLTSWLALPTDPFTFITRPYTLVSYMFFHEDFIHILFNLMWLYFAGRLFMEYLGGRRLLSTYLLGGLIGGLLYVVTYNVFPAFSEVVGLSNNRGASAGVMAIVIGAATFAPNLKVRLFFTLEVKLWIIAAISVVMDLVYLSQGNNAGGHIAHIGGAFFGYISVSQFKKGKDLTEGFSRFMDNIVNWFKPKSKIKKVYTNTRNDENFKVRKNQSQQRMNTILDKISKSGYDSLSKEEKEFLFKIGKD